MQGRKVYRAIGLMSGTSLDGVDAALIETDGASYVRPLGFHTQPYTDGERAKIRGCFGMREARDPWIRETAEILTRRHIEAVRALDAGRADVIGFHGQTITHDPERRFTLQIGDGDLLAQETGIDVVSDFRSHDVRAGGQGAPFLPLYHRARAQNLPKPLAILNIGGVANVTWIGKNEDDILAFDTGPGNALMDDLIKTRTGKDYDENGALARSGRPAGHLLADWHADPYFSRRPPKSLDRDQWTIERLQALGTADALATLSMFTGETILAARRHLPEKPKAWYVTGGGRKNANLLEYIRVRLNRDLASWIRKIRVEPVEALGWNGDALEAEGFAWLAVRSLLGKPLSLPQTTGVPAPQTGGVLHRAG